MIFALYPIFWEWIKQRKDAYRKMRWKVYFDIHRTLKRTLQHHVNLFYLRKNIPFNKKNSTGFSCNFKCHISEPRTWSCFLNILWLWTRMGKQPTSTSWTPCGAKYSPTRTVEVLNSCVLTSGWCTDKGTRLQWIASHSPGWARRWSCSTRSPVVLVYFYIRWNIITLVALMLPVKMAEQTIICGL